MSSQSEVAGYIKVLEESHISIAVRYAGFALLLHDYLLNFSREVTLIWQQRFTLLTGLYILNYYPMAFGQLLGMSLNSDTLHCTALYQTSQYITLLSVINSAVFQITRTYAIWNHNLLIASGLSLLIIPTMVIYLWATSVSTCATTSLSALELKLETIASVTGYIFLFLVLMLTISKTFQSARQYKTLHKVNDNISGIILQNASVYFLLVFSFNTLGLVFNYESPIMRAVAGNTSEVLETILLSRLMLDLREKTIKPNGTISDQLPYISSLYMTMKHVHSDIMEELGDPLYHTSYEQRSSTVNEEINL